ncbi:MAG: M48 family metallopeptidase [Armatimonadota bacterium]
MQNPERWLGDILSAAVTSANGLLDDPLLRKSVVRITRALTQGKSSPRILILDTAVVNAWTLPGNTILITRGLATWAETDDILAGIIAHELGHVERHHAWRQLSQSILLKVIFDRIPTNDRKLRLVLNGISILTALSWSRSHEVEADRFASERLAISGFSPDAWWRFLDERAQASPIAELLSTHPSDATRVRNLKADLQDRVQRLISTDKVSSLRTARLGFKSGEARLRKQRTVSLWDKRGQYRQKLLKTFSPQSILAPLQRLIIWNVPASDPAILIVAGHVFALQEQLSDILATLSNAISVIDNNSAPRAEPLIDRTIACASRAQTAIGLVLADVHTRLAEPPARALAAKGTRFAVREGLLLKAHTELDIAFGAIIRLDVLVDSLRMSRASERIKDVLSYNNARDACGTLIRLDGIELRISPDASQTTLELVRQLLMLENPTNRTGFTYIDTIEVAVDAAIEQGCAWSISRYLDALAAELEGIEQ